MLKITFGSIFDKKCDLLVIPCNTGGGVSTWVSSDMRQNSIPLPDRYISLGKVILASTQLRYENSAYVGFAASVELETNTSNISAIDSISQQILTYSKKHEFKQINLPLLGTGAGSLSEFEVIETYSKILNISDSNEITFEVFVPSHQIYETLLISYPGLTTNFASVKIDHPRVFLSYEGNDKLNSKWVKELAVLLRQNGVDARIDVFHLQPGMDLPQWMTNEVIMSDKVILVCDFNYVSKANIHKGGVGWETMIIQGDMLSQGETKSKYIAIVREEKIDKGLPIYLKSKLALHWTKSKDISDENLKELLFAIFDCDTAPEIGTIPDFIKEKIA